MSAADQFFHAYLAVVVAFGIVPLAFFLAIRHPREVGIAVSFIGIAGAAALVMAL